MKTVLSLPLLALVTGSGMAFAQTPAAPKEPPKFYKLEFVFHEVDGGKVLNSRSYSAIASAGGDVLTIRAGGRVPISSGGTQFTYYDLGVNIDCRAITEVPRDQALSLTVTADISSIPTEAGSPVGPPPPAPTIRQTKWSSGVIVPLKKPTLLFASDDLMSKRQVQLELTATPIQ
ncbi:MAG: hypothetical protein ABSH40_07995 [Bryobacteraceae bacterium]